MTAALHRDAVASLTAWTPPSPAQAGLRERYLTHLTEHDDGMTRGSYPDHLTASTLVLSADGDRVLLTLHAKARQWFQFGGHCLALACRVSSTRSPSAESTRVLAVRWSG